MRDTGELDLRELDLRERAPLWLPLQKKGTVSM